MAALNVAGIGRVCMWQGGSLWIGREAGHAHPHSHHAIQIAVALDGAGGRFRLRGGADDWSAYEAAIVLPDCRHEFNGGGGFIAQIFVEPETRQGRALTARFAGADIVRLAREHRSLVTELRRGRHGASDEALASACRRFVDSLGGPTPPQAAPSPRVAAALAYIPRHLASSVTLRDVAEAVHLSPSRLRHLFVRETGTTFRAYVLWLRIQRAISVVTEGHSWTVAAQEAGFADSAHLSRTFRRTYGVSPVTVVRE